MENKVTVVLADANEEFRTMLRQRMEATGEFHVTGNTGDGEQALELVRRLRPQPPHQLQGLFPVPCVARHVELACGLHPLTQHGPKFLIGICQYDRYLVFHFVPTLFT